MSSQEPEAQDRETISPTSQETMVYEVGTKEARHIKARQRRERSTWFGLGMFGIVGWSIATPTLLGILLGLWLDAARPGQFSWTLALLLAGVFVGCLNAWYWVSKEGDTIRRERNDIEDGSDADDS